MAKSTRKKAYHHGDLRTTILKAAVSLIAERGLHGLSLRECARRAGVSHAAPYRHFQDKNALLLAIAREGFDGLAEAGEQAMLGITDPRQRLDAYGATYVRFAVEHPVHHKVMFASELETPSAQDKASGTRAFELLVETAAAVVGPEQAELAAVASWSLSHGLSMLILDGRIPQDRVSSPEDAEELTRALIAQWRGPLTLASPPS
ncbi:MAG: TetR/AcrR family transcriptional regulator [Nannocystaceae bacterium]